MTHAHPPRSTTPSHWRPAAALALALLIAAPAVLAQSSARAGDYILAIVNQELVTAGELEKRLARVRDNAARAGAPLPPADELRRQVLDALIDERVQITHARDAGLRVDEAELDRAVSNVAAQNQVTLAQLRQRLTAEGIDYGRFRNNLRDQIMLERVREREVQGRIRVSDAEIDALIETQRARAGGATEYNIAQILVGVPDGAAAALVAERQARAEAALARLQTGSAFDAVAREVSDDPSKAQGGELGLRPASRLPDVFVERVRGLKAGELAPALLRTGAGFHVLKLLARREAGAFAITQTRARHILLRTSAQMSREAAVRRLGEIRRQIEAGRSFEQLAREHSEDGSAPIGGDLGWAAPGQFVPEFEQAMDPLPAGGLSEPVLTRFGVHLIQVVDRRQQTLDERQQREQAQNVLREQKFDEAYLEWLRDLRARAYIELRDPPN